MMKHEYVFGEDISREHPEITVTIERIDRDTAEKMLDANTRNRAARRREQVTDALINGEWRINGSTIVFADDGTLLDGQHRLLACMKTGIPIETVVVRGVKPKTQLTIDCGIKRQVSDHLKLFGYKNSTNLATVGVALKRLDDYGLSTCCYRSSRQVTIKSAVDFIEKNKKRVEFIYKKTVMVTSRYKGVTMGMLAPIVDCIYQIDEDSAEDFIMQLARYKTPTQPVEKLVNILLDNSMRKEKVLSQKYIAAITIKAWNAYMSGAEIKQLKYTAGGAHPEQFPQLQETFD